MIEPRWELKIGSPVLATDGEYGRLQELILDPNKKQVLALVVRRKGLINPYTALVPADAVAEVTESEVRLKVSREEVDALPGYQPDPGLSGSERERFGIQVSAGQQVYCRDGHAGRVSLILIDPDGRANGFVMRAGHLPGRCLIVPAAWVQEAERDSVHLPVEKSALEGLPNFDPDDALAAEVENALWSDDVLRNTDYRQIGVTVRDGITRLRGHVVKRMNKIRAENAARSVPGVLGVENLLVVDEELVVEVAQALGRNQLTRSETVLVGAQNGVILLNGQVSSAAIREAAEEAAASVPQVRGVANYLQAPGVVVDPQEQQVRQPPIGQEVYATDMQVGHVERVIINPRNRRVSAFVAHGNFPDPQRASEYRLTIDIPQQERRIVIPIQAINYLTDSSVLLNTSSVEAARNRDFDPADFISPPEGWQPPYPYDWGDVLAANQSVR